MLSASGENEKRNSHEMCPYRAKDEQILACGFRWQDRTSIDHLERYENAFGKSTFSETGGEVEELVYHLLSGSD
jgi:hypothetical protein